MTGQGLLARLAIWPISGDGGNRTRVRGRVTKGVYRLSRRLILASRVRTGRR
jgi:hypothetical protein